MYGGGIACWSWSEIAHLDGIAIERIGEYIGSTTCILCILSERLYVLLEREVELLSDSYILITTWSGGSTSIDETLGSKGFS